MLDIFKEHDLSTYEQWLSLNEVDDVEVEIWKKISMEFIDPDLKSMPIKFDVPTKEKKIRVDLLDIVRKELKLTSAWLPKAHLFLLSDCEGVILECFGSETVTEMLNVLNIDVGTSFALKDAGINAISVALYTKSATLLMGEEHHLRMFANWTCACMPITFKNMVIAYLDLSFQNKGELPLLVALLENRISIIEKKLCEHDPDLKKESFYCSTDNYKFTPREKEIAYRWWDNQSILRISLELGITEGTVRNFIKKIYTKTASNEKLQFIKKINQIVLEEN
ncbi:hypothetical protein HQN87_19725 [Paenibacillus tritici]|uniref:HTH luxR-type domain-containing protein n=1 Tax=Paenibacillus tritici TaxID=1873425 RepID=A0ABX2DTY9_9BACL|nr:hypothetical protein [Paenibacillus tritici]NQX47569.1 hypothetical protein [Paenibacillus tritici]